MATLSSMPLQRPKKMVRYGKSTSRSTYSTKHVADFLDDDLPAPTATTSKASVKETYTVQKKEDQQPAAHMTLVEKLEVDMGLKKSPMKQARPIATMEKATADAGVKKSTLPAAKPRTKKQDAFDVPSSEDEVDVEVPMKRISPPRARTKRTLVDDTAAQDPQLAPWEKRKDAPKPALKAAMSSTGERDMTSTNNKSTVKPVPRKAKSPVTSPARNIEPHATTAAARLAARRQLASNKALPNVEKPVKVTSATNKRAGASADILSSSPRKRARKSPPSEDAGRDVDVAHHFPEPSCEMPSKPSVTSPAELDVFDLPDDSADEAPRPKRTAAIAKAPAKNPRRVKLPSSTRTTPRKGLSAPARLTEMLPIDIDSTDAPSRSPSALPSVPSTPRRSATPAKAAPTATPPALLSRSSSATSAAKVAGTLTPKQKSLWSQLLPSDPIAPSPSALAIRDLTLEGKRRTAGGAVSLARTLTKSRSDVPEMHRRRTRLVDRLKATASDSEEDEISEEEEDSDVEMEDAEAIQPVVDLTREPAPEAAEKVPPRPSQSQSQSQTAATEAGARITYARTRSYLPEDNLEDGLMFDLPSETLQRLPTLSRAPSKVNATSQSQKSAFDLQDSDDESGGAGLGRLRTIHELRAAGRNDRFMRETEALLEDIADHSSSAKSRRRSGLIELATKLADKAYAERFVGQGFEHKLVVECNAAEDEVADYALTATIAVLMATEPPEHVLTLLKEGGVLSWLAKRLRETTEITWVAKNRKNNMSKSAQNTLLDFADKTQKQPSLWEGHARPQWMSTRLMALKAIDQLVGRLRRLGDRSELLDTEVLQHVLPPAATLRICTADMSLAISILEALSTSALALAWPKDVLERLAALLPILETSPNVPTHTLFLAFRLALNLTNDNARNCAVFATEEVVHYLLRAIKESFEKLEVSTAVTATTTTEEQRAIELDMLVLGMGVMINLSEHSSAARQFTITAETTAPTLTSLLEIFQQGLKRMEDAESVEESTSNVAFGYLAVMLANICLDTDARRFVAEKLPGQGLGMLVAAVEEFVMHHQKVDMLTFEGEEAVEVWEGFTGRLKGVLGRLRVVVDEDGEGV